MCARSSAMKCALKNRAPASLQSLSLQCVLGKRGGMRSWERGVNGGVRAGEGFDIKSDVQDEGGSVQEYGLKNRVPAYPW